MICNPHQLLFGDKIKKNEMNGASSKYGRELHTAFCCGNLRERPLGRPKRRWEDNIKMDI